jgi:beta-1,4-mannosyl-glycoprotein beta-1,4-N-acetylglucosaminyltransferase
MVLGVDVRSLVKSIFVALSIIRCNGDSSPKVRSNITVVDFTFYNGEPIGIHRYLYLKEVVDMFLIVEFNETFSGHPKPYYYQRLEPYLLPLYRQRKILVKDMHFPPMKDIWTRENYARNIGAKILLDYFGSHKFIVIVSDIDEIPSRPTVVSLPQLYTRLSSHVHRLHMTFHYYSFKWVKSEEWLSSFVVNDEFLRQHHKKTLTQFRNSQNARSYKIIKNGGWHCSYFMNASEILRKLRSFPHQEFNKPPFNTIEWIQRCMDEGIDVYNRTQEWFILRKFDSTGMELPNLNSSMLSL